MIRGFLISVLLVAIVYAASFVLFVSTLPTAPDVTPVADGIVALTGGDTRLDAATSLLEHKQGSRMLVSGAAITTTHDTLKNVMHGGARFDCCVDLGYAAEDTHGNAVEAAEWTRQHHFGSIILVTGRYHMPRSLREFQHQMPDITIKSYPVDEDGIDLSGWWLHRSTAALLHREYMKYLASLVMTSIT